MRKEGGGGMVDFLQGDPEVDPQKLGILELIEQSGDIAFRLGKKNPKEKYCPEIELEDNRGLIIRKYRGVRDRLFIQLLCGYELARYSYGQRAARDVSVPKASREPGPVDTKLLSALRRSQEYLRKLIDLVGGNA